MKEKTLDYSNTLNLPKTSFPMKGNLPVREKEFLEKWEHMRLYEKWVAKNKGRKKFILHDGPPYSNGDIHIVTALNRTLKDVVIRFKALTGHETPFIPG